MGSGSRALSCLCCPCRCVLSCLCSILVSLLFTAGAVVLVLYLLFRPHMVAATVDSASLAEFALAAVAGSSAQLRYNLTVAMDVRNPNKRFGLYYDGVESLALFEEQRFGYVQLDSFFQGAEPSTKLSPEFHGQQLVDGDITQANFRSQQSAGAFSVEVKLNAKLRIFKFQGAMARITCPLSIPAPGGSSSSAAAAAFQTTDCKVWF